MLVQDCINERHRRGIMRRFQPEIAALLLLRPQTADSSDTRAAEAYLMAMQPCLPNEELPVQSIITTMEVTCSPTVLNIHLSRNVFFQISLSRCLLSLSSRAGPGRTTDSTIANKS